MKSLIALFSICLLFAACSSDDNGSVPSAEIINKSVQDSPTPYAVSNEQREQSVAELLEMRKKMLELEGHLIAPATEDLDNHKAFLEQQGTGIMRLFPRNSQNEKRPLLVQGNGSYFQFKAQVHEYGQGNDIEYSTSSHSNPQFSVGFAGVDYGFFANLGKVDINTLSASTPEIQFALSHHPPHNQPEAAWRQEQNTWSAGQTINQVEYNDDVDAIVGNSYVVRSINESNYDVVVAFQVIRRDETDDSLIVAWKMIKEFSAPVMAR